jgi:signal transduction histidine kinase
LVKHVATQCSIALRQARLYTAAQEQVKALEQLHLLKDDFLSTVSHELRSPVTNMKMALQMLNVGLTQVKSLLGEDSPTGLSQRLDQYLHILKTECDREIDLVNDLLDLQRLESSHQGLELTDVDVDALVKPLTESFQKRASARQQQLKVAIASPLPSIVSNGDALNRILSELLHNACKYTPPQEAIVCRINASTHHLQIHVKNFGAQIPPDALPHIFEKFYRAPHTDRWQQGGTGLGLALVQELVKHLHGTIAVHSDPAYTLFTVQLPIHHPLKPPYDYSTISCDCTLNT